MEWGYCLRYLPWAIHGPGHLDHGSAIHGSTVPRRRSSNTPIPCLNQLHVLWLLVGEELSYGRLILASRCSSFSESLQDQAGYDQGQTDIGCVVDLFADERVDEPQGQEGRDEDQVGDFAGVVGQF